MEINYSYLKNWIYHNPRIVNVRRFCIELGIKQQYINYYLKNKKPLPKDIVDRAVKTFGLTKEQEDKFFYFGRGCKK